MNLSEVTGIAVGLKLTNGKFKPKFGIKAAIGMIFFFLLFIFAVIMFIIGLKTMNFEYIFVMGFGMVGVAYILLISAYLQRSSNYYIEFPNPNTFEGFILKYKNQDVNIKYNVDSQGKFMFYNNNNKLSCVEYANGAKMSKFTKYRIINYFSKWLNDYNYLSDEVTVTFEK